ncbi:hypothetical protein GCM10018965_082710 [Nonomuraea roseola]
MITSGDEGPFQLALGPEGAGRERSRRQSIILHPSDPGSATELDDTIADLDGAAFTPGVSIAHRFDTVVDLRRPPQEAVASFVTAFGELSGLANFFPISRFCKP